MTEKYYEIINNVKYDKQLLDKAKELITGKGDGRISEDDAKILIELSEDGYKVTDIEKQTLQYIIDNFNCTEPAIAIILPNIN
tara:strand:- start:171 stop:419 length:249 start_codon:yes stop_codon:yes gene_type:complete